MFHVLNIKLFCSLFFGWSWVFLNWYRIPPLSSVHCNFILNYILGSVLNWTMLFNVLWPSPSMYFSLEKCDFSFKFYKWNKKKVIKNWLLIDIIEFNAGWVQRLKKMVYRWLKTLYLCSRIHCSHYPLRQAFCWINSMLIVHVILQLIKFVSIKGRFMG